jgi:hypothetical protein
MREGAMPRITKPVVVEQPGSPEYYADGGTVIEGQEVVQIVLFVTRRFTDGVEHREIARIHMGRTGFMQSLITAAMDYLPTGMN